MKRSHPNTIPTQQPSIPSSNSSQHPPLTPEQQSPSTMASILSPRNIMKFFTKNMEEIVSPRLSAFMGHGQEGHEGMQRYVAHLRPAQVQKEYGSYLAGITHQFAKYNNNRGKRLAREQAARNDRGREREEMEEEIKIGRIPEQYFQDWDKEEIDEACLTQLEASFLCVGNTNTPDDRPKNKGQTHKSLKLRTLLLISQPTRTSTYKSPKKPLPRRFLLQTKQTQLQTHLDELQLILYTKTCKYPDRYLHYLANINDSDIEVNGLVEKVGQVRGMLEEKRGLVQGRYGRVRGLERARKAIGGLLGLMMAMRDLREFKRQSKGHASNKQDGNNNNGVQQRKQSRSGTQLMRYLYQHPQLPSLSKLTSIKETLANIEQLARTIRSQRLSYICDLIRKTLTSSLKNTYDRQAWLKSQLPRDALMVHRMRPEIQAQMEKQSGEDGAMNSSYMNISVLDQSYCVGSVSNSSGASGLGKKEVSTYEVGLSSSQFADLAKQWQNYCKEYCLKQKKLQQQDEQICQIFQRIVLKFVSTFNRDLQDYIAYIYSQKSVSIKHFPSSKQLAYYIQPKLFNKLTKVYFQALSTTHTLSLIFKSLPTLCSKILTLVKQKIINILKLRNLGDYQLVQNRCLQYEDVVELVSGLDYWLGYCEHVGGKLEVFGGGDLVAEAQAEAERMMVFEEGVMKRKYSIVEEFMANLHKHALITDLKVMIEREDFRSISIPVSSFSILDSIINWGQTPTPNPFLQPNNPLIQQSFNYGTAILSQHSLPQVPTNSKHRTGFSIFKVIDKKLIIEGKQYRICESVILLAVYLGVYLKAKGEFGDLGTAMDERICEIVGFYIWYCKKMVFTSASATTAQQKHNLQAQSHTPNNVKTPNHSKNPHSTLPTTHSYSYQPPKKTIPNLCMLINLCDLLAKFMDILNITSKPKKVQKVVHDFKAIREQAIREISMMPFLEVERQISCLYESRLKTRKEIPTKQSVKIAEVLQTARRDLEQFCDNSTIKKSLENTVKIISKNYFGYLNNMEARGKAELKWFVPRLREVVGDIFGEEIGNLEKSIRF